MSCDEAREGLQDYVDGIATAEVEAHLAGCGSCRGEVERLRALKTRLASLPDAIEPPTQLWDGIEAALQARGTTTAPFAERARAWRPTWAAARWVAAAAAVVVVTVGTFHLRLGAPPGPGHSTSGPFVAQEAAALEWVCAGAHTILTSQFDTGPVPPSVAAILVEVGRVDTAIAEVRRELEAPTASTRGVDHLARLCTVKLRLLHKAAKLSHT